MSKQIKFTVLSPAMRPPVPPLPPMPDPRPIYIGTTPIEGVCPTICDGAILTGGTQVAGKWRCNYVSGQFTIPGMGEVEFL